MLYVESRMDQINNNELNNLIYIFLKYTFKFDSPDNSDIAAIMGVVKKNRDRDTVIKETVKYVKEQYGRNKLGNLSEMLKHMNFVFDEFFNLPHNLRNDLGEDKDASEFLVKN